MTVQMVDASRLRALVGFEDLIEPVSRAFQDFSAGLAESSIDTYVQRSSVFLRWLVGDYHPRSTE